MIESKKCKGINKAYGFSGCGNMVSANERKAGLCPKCYGVWLFSTDEGEITMKKTSLNMKAGKLVSEMIKPVKKNKPKKPKDKLQEKINTIAKLIDRGKSCLVHPDRSNDIQAGHIFSRGAEVSMRYNLHNIHRQSGRSNTSQNEDVLLRKALIREYGGRYFHFLITCRKADPIKMGVAEYAEKIEVAESIVKWLIAIDKVYSKEDRLNFRSKINLELAIYPTDECLFINKL